MPGQSSQEKINGVFDRIGKNAELADKAARAKSSAQDERINALTQDLADKTERIKTLASELKAFQREYAETARLKGQIEAENLALKEGNNKLKKRMDSLQEELNLQDRYNALQMAHEELQVKHDDLLGFCKVLWQGNTALSEDNNEWREINQKLSAIYEQAELDLADKTERIRTLASELNDSEDYSQRCQAGESQWRANYVEVLAENHKLQQGNKKRPESGQKKDGLQSACDELPSAPPADSAAAVASLCQLAATTEQRVSKTDEDLVTQFLERSDFTLALETEQNYCGFYRKDPSAKPLPILLAELLAGQKVHLALNAFVGEDGVKNIQALKIFLWALLSRFTLEYAYQKNEIDDSFTSLRKGRLDTADKQIAACLVQYKHFLIKDTDNTMAYLPTSTSSPRRIV